MSLWYDFWELLPFEIFHHHFMCNALLAVILMAPLFGLCSTMIVTGRMSFFSDALGHSAFTGIAIGSLFGILDSTWVAVLFSIAFSLLFSYVRARSSHAADTIIGVFSSTAVALGIFIATLDGGSFTKYNRYLIGDVLSITPAQIGWLALILILIVGFWILFSNKLTLSSIHPQLASSRGVPVALVQGAYTVLIAIVVTLSISWVGLLILNSLLILPAASARNISKNIRQYHAFSLLFAGLSGVLGLIISCFIGTSTGAVISMILALIFAVTFLFRKVRS